MTASVDAERTFLHPNARQPDSTSNSSLIRSRDAGDSWEVLTLQNAVQPGQRDGGREAFWVRVHRKTRDAWVAGGCSGLWRHVYSKGLR